MDLKKYPRYGGFFIFVLSAGLSTWFYQNAVDRAAARTSDAVGIPFGFAALVSIAVVGLAAMIFGKKMQEYSAGLKNRQKTIKDYLIIGSLLAPGFAAMFFLKHQLAQLGYN
jgi:hypothetical protein